jgi:hypothetical protein
MIESRAPRKTLQQGMATPAVRGIPPMGRKCPGAIGHDLPMPGAIILDILREPSASHLTGMAGLSATMLGMDLRRRSAARAHAPRQGLEDENHP